MRAGINDAARASRSCTRAVARSDPPALIWVTTTAVSTTQSPCNGIVQHLGDREGQQHDERHAQAEPQLGSAGAEAGD